MAELRACSTGASTARATTGTVALETKECDSRMGAGGGVEGRFRRARTLSPLPGPRSGAWAIEHFAGAPYLWGESPRWSGLLRPVQPPLPLGNLLRGLFTAASVATAGHRCRRPGICCFPGDVAANNHVPSPGRQTRWCLRALRTGNAGRALASGTRAAPLRERWGGEEAGER